MPRPLRRPLPNELSVMRDFFDREVQRVQYMHQVHVASALEEEDSGIVDDVNEEEMDARQGGKLQLKSGNGPGSVEEGGGRIQETGGEVPRRARRLGIGLTCSTWLAAPGEESSEELVEVKEGEVEKTEFWSECKTTAEHHHVVFM